MESGYRYCYDCVCRSIVVVVMMMMVGEVGVWWRNNWSVRTSDVANKISVVLVKSMIMPKVVIWMIVVAVVVLMMISLVVVMVASSVASLLK